MASDKSKLAKLAFKFVLTIGIVNLFADMTVRRRAQYHWAVSPITRARLLWLWG
jgi:hypothetical protein